MKKLILSLVFITGFTAVNAQRISDTKPAKKENDVVQKQTQNKEPQADIKIVDATIDFESKVVDYGTIEHNADGARKFVFTNNGTEPLVIKNAKGSCGCTVPTWPREPIAPGETSEIGVKYATNRVGKFTKTITLTTNASKKPVILTVKGEVNPGPNGEGTKHKHVPKKKIDGAPLEKK